MTVLNMKAFIEIYQVLKVLGNSTSVVQIDHLQRPQNPPPPQLLREYTSFNPCYVTGGCRNSFTSHLEFIESI